MHCSNCGKQIADNSRFCSHCGAAVEDSAPVEWEYKDFVITWEEGHRLRHNTASFVATRQDMWNELQSQILPTLREWQDKGWQPVTQVGVGGFEWRQYKRYDGWFTRS